MEKNILFRIGLVICTCSTLLISVFVIFAPEKMTIGLIIVFVMCLIGGLLGLLSWYQRKDLIFVPDSEKIESLEKGKIVPFDGFLLTSGHFNKLLKARDYAIKHGFMWN